MANRKGAITGAEFIRVVEGQVESDVSPAQLLGLIGAGSATDQAATAAALAAYLATLHLSGAGAPVDYTDGTPPATGEGVALKGALYSDTTGGLVYRNKGTQAQPIWQPLADAIV